MALVFGFDHEHPRPPMELKGLLGGKGANLAEMSSVLGLPVPPGFTISTKACQAYMLGGWPGNLSEEVGAHRRELEEQMGAELGDPTAPLLVSVRSGARFSMPGMMDTVLNLGLNDESVQGLAAQTDDPRFAYDSYRRFIQMYGKIVCGVDGEAFDAIFDEVKLSAGATADRELTAESLSEVIDRYKVLVEREAGDPFPQEPGDQLRGAVEAVFASWNSPRAIAYRRREHITGNEGTAVNVQAMVFGNRDDNSGTGVGFTRNPATGEHGSYGDFLVNAQGEDVVAGIRKTLPLAAMGDHFPGPYSELLEIFDRLEAHYRDMLDTEFTIEQGKLWMLQTRVGKRTGAAALRIAVAMTRDPEINLTQTEAVQRVSPEHLDPAAAPAVPDSRQARDRHRPGSIAGRCSGACVLHRRRCSGGREARGEGDPGPRRDISGGRTRHGSIRRGAHHAGRARQPRGGGRTWVGEAGRGGCGRTRHRGRVVQGRRHHRERG